LSLNVPALFTVIWVVAVPFSTMIGWGAPRALRITICLGGERIDPEALDLPAIAGLPANSHRP
jgi:hypothetical protein